MVMDKLICLLQINSLHKNVLSFCLIKVCEFLFDTFIIKEAIMLHCKLTPCPSLMLT